MLDMLNETFNKEEDNSKSISAIEDQLERITEKLKQQPPGKTLDITQVNEVCFLCNDNVVHNPTPPKLELVVEDYVSLDDQENESMIERKEAIIELENYNEEFHLLEASKVGEGFVEVGITSYPTTFKKPEPQLLDMMDSKRLNTYKQLNVIIDHPLLATIFSHISCREGAINVTYGNHKVIFIFLGPTNDPPISGELFVINTIDDYVYEHTANMLYGTTHNLEKNLSCNRSKALDDCMSQHKKRRLGNKKHDNTHSQK
ncbi:unnamed protein product [Lactuca saligna]|uniref:Uncharacterized protein n=1 Tax=Lactuca saligna TaxID=75948 RepID=A0AA35Z8M3_LACSI|nr:unnamed protein product [Lactuca saligna]